MRDAIVELVLKPLGIALIVAACSVEIEPQAQATKEAAQSTRVAETVATLMPQTSTPVLPTPEADRCNFLILGIDKAYWRDSDPKRPHTDFMVVASVHDLGEVGEVTLVQIPRNVFIPLPKIPDDFAFCYY